VNTLLASSSIWIDDNFYPDSDSLFAQLLTSVAWDERIRARKAASFGLPYNYSGITWPETPFPAELLPVLSLVSARLGYEPNNGLANYYPDAESTMGYHSDATNELEPGTGIVVLSLGAERIISFRSQHDHNVVEHYPLRGGSLLRMSAEMQLTWKHAILRAETASGGRISLTFRRMRIA
jgi:alkylated DNA repair dioxygenase AlkB